MNSVNDSDEKAKNSTKSTARHSAFDAGRGGDDEPPASRGGPSGPVFGPPQLAIRLGDGAMLMAVNEHASDRVLEGREMWLCFVLTPEEARHARQMMETAEHEAAVRIAVRLPRKL